MFNTLTEAKDWIENSHRFGDKLDLKRMEIACEILGHPERAYSTIHVAGTNGKGSTASYLKNILMESGYKVGLYISPYVVKFNERISINNDYISNQDVIIYANRIKELWDFVYENHQEAITFFEILTLMSFIYFKDKQIEIGVIEVGLGGTLDATNVITPLVSVITNISYDHMKQLGDTLESIALNKLGIVKQNGALVTSDQNESLFPLFEEYTMKKNALLKRVDYSKLNQVEIGEVTKFHYKNEPYVVKLPGVHQVKNAALAIEVIHYLRPLLKREITETSVKNGLYNTFWPGRFEIFNHNIILDGAHNTGGFASLEETVKIMYPGKKIKCLLCMMKDKEHSKVINELDQMVDEFHFTQIEYPRRADAITLYEESNHPKKMVHEDFKSAVESLSHLEKDEILLITGSLYFISEVRKLFVQDVK